MKAGKSFEGINASSPDVADVTGVYFYKSKIATPAKEAQNDADAKKLWEVSAFRSGVGSFRSNSKIPMFFQGKKARERGDSKILENCGEHFMQF